MEFALPQSVGAILRPPEDLLPSQWVERHRILHDKDAAEPGPFRFDRIPYMVEPTDALVEPGVRQIVYIKASRCSGTELLNNALAYSIDARPMPTIYVLPKADAVDEEFKGRLRRMIEASPKLNAHRSPGNWATEAALSFDTMAVMAANATVPGDFIRRTSGLNLFDEVDNCVESATSAKLGDIWTLLEDRLTTFGYRARQLGVCTPTVTDAAAWRAWERSDQRKYWCPCPYCGTYQVLQFDQIKLIPGHEHERDADRVKLLDLAQYECENPACRGLVPESQKLWMTQRGLWVPKAQKIVQRLDADDPEQVERAHFRVPRAERWTPKTEGQRAITERRGYWTDVAVSPWRTFSEFLARFFATKETPKEYRVFYNGWRALPWQESTQTASASDLWPKVHGGHAPDVIPARASQLVCYADVQPHWLWYVVAALGPGEEIWIIRNGQAETFDEVERIAFETAFPYEDDPTQSLTCDFLAYDSGHRTFQCYERHATRPHQILLTKGDSRHDPQRPKWEISHLERYLSGQRKPTGIKLHLLNTGLFKEKLYELYQRPGIGPGTLHLHRETTQAFLDQATAEEYVPLRKKKAAKAKYGWQLKVEGRANHYLDVLVGILFMADRFNARLLPTRDAMRARVSQQAAETSTAQRTGGIRMPDGRPFLATRRR
jgi:phage terminase large subunit GpA-like protein